MNEVVRKALEEQHGLKIGRFLDRGGFAEVYEAESVEGVPCAVKVSLDQLDASGLSSRERDQALQNELENLRLVQTIAGHPHVVTLMDYWVIGGYLVTRWELSTEGSLADLLKKHVQEGRQGIPLDSLLRYTYEAADGIDFLNGRGIYHRDIKPQNLLLFHGRVKLADLGLAKFAGVSTASHTGVGTWGYLPPEAYGDRRLSKTLDLYSLAATYVKLRTGREPFGTNPHEMVKRQEKGEPIVDGLEDWEVPIVRSALAFDPEKRFAGGARNWVQALSRARRKPLPVAVPLHGVAPPARTEPSVLPEQPPVAAPLGDFAPPLRVQPAVSPEPPLAPPLGSGGATTQFSGIFGPLLRKPRPKKSLLSTPVSLTIAGALLLVVCIAVARLIPNAEPGLAQSQPDRLSKASDADATANASSKNSALSNASTPGEPLTAAGASGAADQSTQSRATPRGTEDPNDAPGRSQQLGRAGDSTASNGREGRGKNTFIPSDDTGSRDSLPARPEPLDNPPRAGLGSKKAPGGTNFDNAPEAESVSSELGLNTTSDAAGESEQPLPSASDSVGSPGTPSLAPEDAEKDTSSPNSEPDTPKVPFATPQELEQAVAACASDSERISLCTSVASHPQVVPSVAARAQELREKFKRAVEADSLADEACVLLEGQKVEAAREELKEANKLAPDRVRAIFLLGLVEALELRQPEEAQRAFKEALKRAPKHAAVLNNLAIIELRLGHVTRAVNYFKAALAQVPGMRQAINNLRRVAAYARLGGVKLTKRSIEEIEKFCDEQGGARLDPRVGWLFVDLSAGGEESSGLRVAMNPSWQAWEDHVCLRCNGLGTLDCPNCAQGSVNSIAEVTSPGLYDTQRGTARRNEPCSLCHGAGELDCPFCYYGKD